MAANLTARKLRVLIGADLQDWSASVASFTPQQESFSGGSIAHQASLTLLAVPSAPESLDPRANPTRWRPGQVVQISIRNAANSAWLPFTPLYLLEIPAVPSREAGALELALGCWLVWASSREQEAERSGVELGTATNTATVATRLLEAADVPSANISLGTWPYSLAVPLVKEAGDSFVSQAAELAWANDGRYLYQNVAGVIVPGQWSTSPATPVATITLGSNEVTFEPLPDVIQPVEQLKVVAQGFEGADVPNPHSVSQTTFVDSNTFNPNTFGSAGITETVVNSWSLPSEAQTYYEVVKEVRLRQPQGLAFVDSDSIQSTTTRRFSVRRYDGTTRLLMQESEFEVADVRTIMPATINIGSATITTIGTLLTFEQTTDYIYNDQEVVVQMVVTTKEPKIKVDGEATADRASLIPQRIATTLWEEEKPDLWTQRTTERVVARDGGERRGNIKPTALITQLPQVEPNSPPPGSERWEAPYGAKERHYEATVAWEYPGGASGRTRTRTLTVSPGFSNEQCFALANANLQILEGRASGYYLELPITDDLVWLAPLSQIAVEDGANRWLFRADALTWEYTPTSAKLGCVGILIQRTALADPVGTPLPDFGTGIVPGQTPPPEPTPWQPPTNTGLYLLSYAGQPLLDYSGVNLVDYPLPSLESYLP